MSKNLHKKTFHKSGITIAVLSLFYSFPVNAQVDQPTIFVSGSRFEETIDRIPGNVQVITSQDIQNSTSTDVSEVLQKIGGVVINNQYGSALGIGAAPDLGGYGVNASSNTLVLVNGIRINPIDMTNAPLNNIPLSSIERIEIINGASSVQFGNNATGGAINIITKDGASFNQAKVTMGSYGTWIADASLGLKEDKTSVRISANSSRTNGWRENTDALSNAFNGRITQNLGGGDQLFFEANASHFQGKYQSPVSGEVGKGNLYDSALIANTNSPFLQDTVGVLGGIKKSIGDRFLFELDTGYSNASSLINNGGGTSADKWQIDLQPRIKANWGTYGSTVLGYDFDQGNLGTSLPPNQFSTTVTKHNVILNNNSFYLIQRFPINDRFELSGGVRRQIQNATAGGSGYDTSSKQNTANAYDVALNYQYLMGQKVYAKYGQSYRFANMDEYFGFNNYVSVFSGILDPQINKTVEIGGSFQVANSKLNVSVLRSVSHNEIIYDPTNSTNVNSPYDINRLGFTLSDKTAINTNFNLGGGLRYQQAVYDNGLYVGNQVPLVPTLTFNVFADYKIIPSTRVGASVNYVSNQFYDGDTSNQNNQMPSYFLGDVFAEYTYKNIETRFTVKNISNSQYAVYGNSAYGYSYAPGNPRMFFLSVKYNFDK